MSDSGAKPSADDLRTGEEALAESLDLLHARVAAHQEELFRSLDQALTSRISAAFSQAQEAHRDLMKEAGIHPGGEVTASVASPEEGVGAEEGTGPEDASGAEGLLMGNRLPRYRTGVRKQVLEPLKETLESLEIGRTLGERWVGFQDALPGLADQLPKSLLRPEPADLYTPRPGEGRITSLRKGLVRGQRSVQALLSRLRQGARRLVQRPVPPPSPRAQEIPLQRLARECLLGPCPLVVESAAEALQQHYAAPLARLEAAVAAWTEEWFETEEDIRHTEGTLGVRFLEELALGAGEAAASQAGVGSGGEEEDESNEGTSGQDRDSASPVSDPGEPARRLSEALALGAGLGSPSTAQEQIREGMEGAWTAFLEAVRVAGSFQKKTGSGRDRKRADRAVERGRVRARHWERWHRASLGRLQMAILLLRLRQEFDEAESLLMAGIVDEVLSPIASALKEARTRLQELLEVSEADLGQAVESGDPERLSKVVEDLLERGVKVVQPSLPDLFDTEESAAAIGTVADGVAARLGEALRFAPETVPLANLQRGDGSVSPNVAVRTVPFREVIQRAVDVLRLEAIRNSPRPVLEFLESAAEECRNIPQVLSYNLTAAREEQQSPPQGALDAVLEDTRSLATDGLAQTTREVREVLEGLGVAWTEFTGTAHELLQTGFREVHIRAVAEGAVQEQMASFRALARAWWRSGLGRLRDWLERMEETAVALIQKGWERGVRLVHLGRTAVGETSAQEGEAEKAMEALRGIPALLDSLPLVYRRLFSFQPVTDASLLVGREEEVGWVARRMEAWRAGVSVPCVLTGPVGVGHTSFLNVVAATQLDESHTFRLSFDRRIRTEEELADLVAKTLGLEADGPWTLPRVADRLMRGTDDSRCLVVLVEHLEHLILRTPGGTDLLEDFLTFQVQTAKRVLWLSNTSGATWKIVEKSEPNAVAMVNRYSLPTLSRAATEELIMVRHRRSGLPVEFLPPPDLNPLIRRRLRLARSEKAKQQILRTEFFDRVHRMSEGSVAMALLLWLRSAEFASREGWLRVHAPTQVRFSFLDGLDLELSFALKAFMEHGSLTLEEYGEIFGTSPAEAYQVFEALRSRTILEPVGLRGVPGSRNERVKQGERYRVPGILSQVVANRLKNRNILH